MKKQATSQEFDKWVRKKEAKPVERYTRNGLSVYIAEGGPHFQLARVTDYPQGWYENIWAIGKDDLILMYTFIEFDKLHNPELTERGRRQARIQECRNRANDVIDGAGDIWKGDDTLENIDGTVEKVHGKESHKIGLH